MINIFGNKPDRMTNGLNYGNMEGIFSESGVWDFDKSLAFENLAIVRKVQELVGDEFIRSRIGQGDKLGFNLREW